MEKSETVEAETVVRPYQRASAIRIILAFLMCPALPYLIVGTTHKVGYLASLDHSLQITAIMSSIVAGFVAVTAGLPMYLLLCRWRALSLSHFLFWGGMIAFVLSLPVFLVMPLTIPLAIIISATLWLALVKLPPIRVGAWTI